MIQLSAWQLYLTDLLFFLFLILMCTAYFRSRNGVRFKRTVIYLVSKPAVVFSLMFFSLFLTIAVADSIHFNTQGRTQSVLDSVLAPLSSFHERSYSKPFATYSAIKSIRMSNNQAQQYYKKLKYPQNPSFFKLMLIWLISSSLICLLLWQLYNRYHDSVYEQYPNLAFKSVMYSMAIVASLFIFACVFVPNYHVLGTDKVGQDVFYQAVKGIRTAFIIGFLTSFILLPFAVCLGVIAGYFGKRLDDLIQFIYTVISSVPGILLIAASFLSLQIFMARHEGFFSSVHERGEFKLLMLCFILGLTSWTSLCRLVRAETLKLREIEYVQAAKTIGSSTSVILFKHILPNLFHIIIIATAIDFSGLVLAEAVLSYVGVGVDPTLYSWGLMINAARLELARDPVVWWPLFASFIMMFTLVLSVNVIADALRDALDPKLAH